MAARVKPELFHTKNDYGSIIYKNFKIKHRYYSPRFPEKIIQMREKYLNVIYMKLR